MCIHSAREFSNQQIDDMQGRILDKVADRMIADLHPMGRCRFCENKARRVLDHHDLPQDGICTACQRVIDEGTAPHRREQAKRLNAIELHESPDAGDPEVMRELGVEKGT